MSLIYACQSNIISTNENTIINKEKKQNVVNSYVQFILDAFLSMCIIIRYIMCVLFSVSNSSHAEF